MLAKSVIAAAVLAQAANAHFGVDYPTWRGDSFEDPYDQWVRPCAGINSTSNGTRTEWPIDGGSVVLELHHAWDYIFVNLGLGTEVTSFNISLTPDLYNNTGNGTLCIPKIHVPASLNIQDGQNASIQVVTLGNKGNALYNCADIVFSSNATILSGDQCQNTTGGELIVIADQNAVQSGNDTQGGDDKPNAAVPGSPLPLATATFAVLMAMVFASGLL